MLFNSAIFLFVFLLLTMLSFGLAIRKLLISGSMLTLS
jgi:hypothetical protein